jgi:Txe/YoeB family toxin of Txe-Axe toxin-antitoxin module
MPQRIPEPPEPLPGDYAEYYEKEIRHLNDLSMLRVIG